MSECRRFSADLGKGSIGDSAKDGNELWDSIQLENSGLSAFKTGLFHEYKIF